MSSAVFVAAELLSTGVSSEEGTWSPDRLIDASKALFDCACRKTKLSCVER